MDIRMTNVKAIYDYIDGFAPFALALSFDNCGMLVGDENREVSTCVIALDMTADLIEFAKQKKADLIITHHPIIFEPLKSVTADDMVYRLIQSGISVICAHTNLDLAVGGVNDSLSDRLELKDVANFANCENIGRVGLLPREMSAPEFASYIKEKLNTPTVSYTDCKKPIKSVALVGGEGSDFFMDSKKYDAYLTGEVKYHIYSYAKNAGIQLFTAGHYHTEAVVLTPLKERLQNEFATLDFIVYDNCETQYV